jgi:hypothetical protein
VLEPPSLDTQVEVRKAAMQDIHPILDLINSYATKGIMLHRTEFELSENILDFSVAYSGDTLVGCGALHFYSPVMGEVRSLAVSPDNRPHGMRASSEGLEGLPASLEVQLVRRDHGGPDSGAGPVERPS